MNFLNKITVYTVIVFSLSTGVFMTVAPLTAAQQQAANKKADNDYLKSSAGKKLQSDIQDAYTNYPTKNLETEAKTIHIDANNATRLGNVDMSKETAEQILGQKIFNRTKAFLTKVDNIIAEINASPLSADGKAKYLERFNYALNNLLGATIIKIMKKE